MYEFNLGRFILCKIWLFYKGIVKDWKIERCKMGYVDCCNSSLSNVNIGDILEKESIVLYVMVVCVYGMDGF